jgi:hypothetical protein
VLKGIEDCIDLAPLHNPTTSREFSWRGTDRFSPELLIGRDIVRCIFSALAEQISKVEDVWSQRG